MSSRLSQRFQNFSRALSLLHEAAYIPTPSITERAGLIQFYEMSFELAWKCLKDYFDEQGLTEKFPRSIIKTGIETEVLTQGQLWLQALNDRNLTSHMYDEQAAIEISDAIINDYLPILSDLHSYLKAYLQGQHDG